MNNDASYEEEMRKEKLELKTAFNKAFLVNIPSTEHKWYDSQTATVQALQFGIVPDEEIENVVNGLVHNITEVKGGHHSTGIHGNRYIYTVLTKYGKGDLAHQILTTPDFPSQTYVMNSGFTSWPERQFEWEKMEGPTNSLNHPMHTGFATYFFESLGGIKSSEEAPGYSEFIVNPEFPSQIKSTDVSIPTPYGNIENKWSINSSVLTMNLKVPFNTNAKLDLTEKEYESLKINNEAFSEFQNENYSEVLDDNTVILGSGDYKIEYIKS